MPRASVADSKHHHVYATLLQEIESGRWKEGERLPSEAQLVDRFGHSRITVGRALSDLQNAGFISRRAGSGSFVTRKSLNSKHFSFGLLIPDLGATDIFDPICRGMMASPLASDHALLWGSASNATDPEDAASRGQHAWQLCRQYIDRRVDGVFFAPVEMTPVAGDVNHRIVEALDAARIPVVLLDRTVTPYPDPGFHDLVGIDNRRAGYVMTEHLLRLGASRIVFVRQPNSATTVDAREAGYREAMRVLHAPNHHQHVARLDPDDRAGVHAMLDTHTPDAIVCANDRIASRVLHTLRRLHVEVPRDIRLVGIDDVEFASLLPVPLTTLRQPTHDIGEVALSLMLERVTRGAPHGATLRDVPPRETRLRADIVIRDSCGATLDLLSSS